MKKYFINRLANKLFLLHIILTVILLVFFGLYNQNMYTTELVDRYNEQLSFVSSELSHEIEADNKKAISAIIDRVLRNHQIEAVTIYDTNGEIYYSMYQDAEFKPEERYNSGESGKIGAYYYFSHPIILDKATLGYLSLTVSQGSWMDRISNESQVVLYFIIFLSISFLAISYLFNRNITKPLLRLTTFAQKITNENNYSSRVQLQTVSEINTLADAFNRMLEQIEVRQSELKVTEQIIRESETRYRMLFELAGDAIFLMEDDIFIDCNSATLEIFGCKRSDIIGQPPYRFSPQFQPDGKQSSEKAMEKIHQAQKGNVQRFEWRHCKLDGTEFDAEVTLNSVSISDSKFVIAVVRDITVRKKREQEEQKIEKLQSVGLLAGGIAHDFNNFLTGILGSISLAMMDIDRSSDMYQRLEEAEQATIRARNLTQQLLTFSRGGEPIIEAASVTKLINDTVSFSLRGSNVDYKLVADDTISTAKIDTGQISQVIQNLTINAKQAMPDGGTITIHLENYTCDTDNLYNLKAGNYIKIRIEDQGIGIPSKFLQRIFDPYFSTKQHGNGLGLATCHSIIKKHGGHIEADSIPGEKTIFTIYLPSSNEAIIREEQNQVPVEAGNGRILVMDDEFFIRELAEKILTRYNYEVVAVEDGKQAIEEYKKALDTDTPFDLVLLDLTVPGGMGGLETLEKLLKIDERVNAIVCSGYSNDPILSKFEKFGFKAMVSKPYRPVDLINSVQSVLSEQMAEVRK